MLFKTQAHLTCNCRNSQTTNWAPVRLPYLKHPSRIPAPLPTGKQFLESTAVFRDDASYHRVVAVGPHFIVKHGLGVRECEGQTLLFLEKHLASFSHITLPKLYAMYCIPSNGHLCLVMELLDGESLDAICGRCSITMKSLLFAAS